MDTLLLIIIGVLSRLTPHPANVTAVGALAVFSGTTYSKTKAVAITIGSMLVSDLFLGFHSVMWATYGCFALSVILANVLLKKRSTLRIAGVTLASSIVFYVVTNFAVWAINGSMYPHTFAGLLDSYIMGFPFFRNSLIGDFFYTGVFFAAFALVRHYAVRTGKKIIF